MDKTKITLGLILMTLLSSGVIYLQYNDVKIRIDEDKTTFYVPSELTGRFVVAGRERSQLFDGTSLMYRDAKNIKIDYTIKDNTTTITRTTPYLRDAIVIDEYFFDGNVENKELVPIYHKITVLNASGKFLRYEAYDLEYDGEREKISGTRKDFGKNMSIEWLGENKRWAWLYLNGKLKIQYDIPSDNEVYFIRMFNPEGEWRPIDKCKNARKKIPVWKERIIRVTNETTLWENGTFEYPYNYTQRYIEEYIC